MSLNFLPYIKIHASNSLRFSVIVFIHIYADILLLNRNDPHVDTQLQFWCTVHIYQVISFRAIVPPSHTYIFLRITLLLLSPPLSLSLSVPESKKYVCICHQRLTEIYFGSYPILNKTRSHKFASYDIKSHCYILHLKISKCSLRHETLDIFFMAS